MHIIKPQNQQTLRPHLRAGVLVSRWAAGRSSTKSIVTVRRHSNLTGRALPAIHILNYLLFFQIDLFAPSRVSPLHEPHRRVDKQQRLRGSSEPVGVLSDCASPPLSASPNAIFRLRGFLLLQQCAHLPHLHQNLVGSNSSNLFPGGCVHRFPLPCTSRMERSILLRAPGCRAQNNAGGGSHREDAGTSILIIIASFKGEDGEQPSAAHLWLPFPFLFFPLRFLPFGLF